jgi:hypothetical protein
MMGKKQYETFPAWVVAGSSGLVEYWLLSV